MFCDNQYLLSPKALCYIKFTFDILSHICEETNLKEIDVVEIGGGYGCQGILLYIMAKHFDIKVNSYTIIDLPEVNVLQRAFIKSCISKLSSSDEYNSSLHCISPEEYKNINKTVEPNFVISNYALGEFNQYWQNFYIDNVVSKTEHGYFCWNFSPTNPNIHSYFNNIKRLIKEEENPQTNTPPIKSYVIRY